MYVVKLFLFSGVNIKLTRVPGRTHGAFSPVSYLLSGMSCALPSLRTSTMMMAVCRISEKFAVSTMQLNAREDFVMCKKHVNLDFTNWQQNVTELLNKLSHN